MKLIPDLFRIQSSSTPLRTAVIAGDDEISYGDLAARVDKLCHKLRSVGIGPSSRIGVCIGPGIDLVTSLLAVQQAGATYVPMDPTYPANALRTIESQAKLDVILTHPASQDKVPEGASTLSVCGLPDAAHEESHASADGLIYVIFTSGSTGIPKGAGVYHHGFLNLLQWFTAEFGVSSRDRTLVVSSPSFDLTQKNFYAPLITGGVLVFAEQSNYDPDGIRRLVAKHGITLLNCTPSAFYPLVEHATDDRLRQLGTLRCVFLGGEPIQPSRMGSWPASPWFHAEVANTYGPTECSDIVAFHRLTKFELGGVSPIPIGQAIWNTQLMVLDESGSRVADGVAGELCVSGAGVGAGYVNDPELTTRRFVTGCSGERMYRTGDLVRKRSDCNFEFLGRADDQVKIRGFRVELPEIETVARRHPDVRDCAAAACGDHLVLFYLADPGHPDQTNTDLRTFLSENLPAHKVPSRIRSLEALPLSPNGKVDRRALESLAAEAPVSSRRQSQSPEQRIQTAWCRVLHRETVGFDENFFEAGGTSLSAVELQNRLESDYGLSITVTVLFAKPTVRLLAQHVRGNEAGSASLSTAKTQRQFAAFRATRENHAR